MHLDFLMWNYGVIEPRRNEAAIGLISLIYNLTHHESRFRIVPASSRRPKNED